MTPLLGWVIGFDAKKGTVPLLLPPLLLLLSNSLLAFCVKGGVQGKREILVGGFLLPGVSNGCFPGVCRGRRGMQSTLLSSGCWGDRVVNNALWSREASEYREICIQDTLKDWFCVKHTVKAEFVSNTS